MSIEQWRQIARAGGAFHASHREFADTVAAAGAPVIAYVGPPLAGGVSSVRCLAASAEATPLVGRTPDDLILLAFLQIPKPVAFVRYSASRHAFAPHVAISEIADGAIVLVDLQSVRVAHNLGAIACADAAFALSKRRLPFAARPPPADRYDSADWKAALEAVGADRPSIPTVLQFTKADLQSTLSPDEMMDQLDIDRSSHPFVVANASTCEGVDDAVELCLREIARAQ